MFGHIGTDILQETTFDAVNNLERINAVNNYMTLQEIIKKHKDDS